MPKMLSAGNIKLVFVPGAAGISDYHAPTVTELSATGVLDLSELVTYANYKFGATGEDTLDDPALTARSNAKAPGLVNLEAGMDFFRWTDVAEDIAWTTFTEAGIDGWLVERKGADWEDDFAAAEELKVARILTGNPQDLTPEKGGYVKFHQEFYPQEQYDGRAIVAAGV